MTWGGGDMLRLARYLRGWGALCVLAPALKCLEALFQLLVPLVMASLVDEGIATRSVSHIWACAGALAAFGVMGWACAAAAQYASAKLGAGFGTAMRDDLFSHVMSLSRADVDRLGSSTLVTRLTNDSNQIQDGVNLFFRLVLRCPIAVFGTVFACFGVSGPQGALFCVVVAVVLAVVYLVMSRAIRGFRAVQGSLDGVLRLVAEQLAGVRVIRAFGRQAQETEEFRAVSRELRSRQVAVGDVAALMNPLTYAAVNLGLACVLWTGGLSIDAGSLTQGELIALANYMTQMLVELLKLANLVNTLSKAGACARRVNEVFATEPSQVDGTLDATRSDRIVELDHVTFAYEDAKAPALSDVSLRLPPGSVTGVIGGTGSGKSTLASLLLRLYDPQRGKVLLGGRSLAQYSAATLRSVIALVDQRPRLFAGTVADNLRLAAPDATDGQLWWALGVAQACDFVRDREGGLAAEVEQRGANFSGGQRQRLCIARTLLRFPSILVLDDASSALDLATDARLRHALATELPGLTIVVISQRVSAIAGADQILVLDQGLVRGLGTHEQLRKECEVYRQICASQLAGGDAA